VKLAIVTRLIQAQQHTQAIQLYNTVLEDNPRDLRLLSTLGCMCLQMGNTTGAQGVFNHVKQLAANGENESIENVSNKEDTQVLLMNDGYVALSQGNFHLARENFTKILALDSSHTVAANNMALVFVYEGQVHKAIKILEEFISQNLTKKSQWETIVFNVCTLYDLAWNDSNDRKKAMLKLVIPFLPDDFDLSIFKIPDLLKWERQ